MSRPWTVAGLLPLLLAGCQGTPLGERLSGSFPGATPESPAGALPRSAPQSPGAAAQPSASAPSVRSPQPRPATAAAAPTTPAPTKAQAVPATNRPAAAAPAAGAQPTPPAPRPRPEPPAAPAPYRITLRLPQADPAAPAEGLTQALRAAGVAFEVETIERMSGAASPAAAVPAVRPAPPPR